MCKQIEILSFFKNHTDEMYSVKQLCKEFNMTTSAMWKNVRQLWLANWLIKCSVSIPAKYKFNEIR